VLRQNIFWNEQYLLLAFLMFNDQFEFVLANHYLAGSMPAALLRAFPFLQDPQASAEWTKRTPSQSVAPQEVAGAADAILGSREASSTTALFYSCIDITSLGAPIPRPAANHDVRQRGFLISLRSPLFTPEKKKSLAESVI